MSDMDATLPRHGAFAVARRSFPLLGQRRILRVWLVIADALGLALAFYLAYLTRFDLSITVAPEVEPDPGFYLRLAASLTPLFLAIFAVLRLYDVDTLLGGVSEYARIFSACTHGHMILIVATFVDTRLSVSRAWVIASWALCISVIFVIRFITRRAVYRLRSRGFLLTPALIVGTNREAAALSRDLANSDASGVQLLGFVETRSSTDAERAASIGTLSTLRETIDHYGAQEVIVAMTSVERAELLAICEEVNSHPRAHLRLSSGLYELLTAGVTVEKRGSVPLVGISKGRLEPGQAMAKTAFEFAVALTAVVLLAPVLLVIAAAVAFDSRGPILYQRRVLGLSGRQFDAFKFRTMHINGADILNRTPDLKAVLETNHKLRNDPRITRVGQVLRRFSLDELPQLFNVLRGEMGLVGPRMISPTEANKYGQHKLALLTVRPGITGLWQVSGRSDLSYEERIRLDMLYIRNYSIWSDLHILLFQTLPAVLSGRGAY